MTTVDFAAASTNADVFALGLPIASAGGGTGQNINGTGARPAAAGGSGLVFRLTSGEGSADHFAEAPLVLASAGSYREAGVIVRTDATGSTGWYVVMDNNAGATQVRVWDFPAFGGVVHSAAVAEGDGPHTLRVEVQGSDLRIYIGGSLKTTWTSATGTGTYCGGAAYAGSVGGVVADATMTSLTTGALSGAIGLTVQDATSGTTADNVVLPAPPPPEYAPYAWFRGLELPASARLSRLAERDLDAFAIGLVLEQQAAGSTALIVDDATSSTTADTPTLTQAHSLTVQDATSASRADRVIVNTHLYPTSIDVTNDVWLDQYGAPIFLVGDSAWSLSAQTAADIDTYLTGIAGHGLRMSLLSAPEPYYTNNTPDYRNENGDDPFVGTPFQSALNEPYWSNVDHIVEKAHELGIYLEICPLYLGANDTEGWRDTLTSAYNADPANLTNYGAAIGDRYAAWPNIGWVIGHDDAALTTQTETSAELIAAELNARTSQLVTVGAARGAPGSGTWSTTSVVYDLDTAYYDNATPGEDAAAVRAGTGTFGWIEGYYEQEHSIAVGAQTLREQLWEPFCAGASYVLFGTNARWHFGLAFPGKPGFAYSGTWQDSLTNPTYNLGTVHAGKLAAFVSAVADVAATLPDTTSTFLTAGTGFARFSTTVGVAYQTAAASITLDTTELAGTGNVRIRRYDPTDGTFSTVAASEAQNATRTIAHPGNNANGEPDWVYVVDLATGTALVVQDATSPTLADSPSLTQVHALTVADATSATTADTPTLAQVHALTVQDATSGTTADSPALTQHHALGVQDATSSTTADLVTLTQVHALTVADATSTTTADGIVLVQQHALTVADATSATLADSVVLVQHHTLAIDDATSTSTADTPTLTPAGALAVDDATSSTTADTPTLTQTHALTVQDATSTTTGDTPTLSITYTIAPNDATSATLADSPNLLQHHTLTVQDATSTTTADGIVWEIYVPQIDPATVTLTPIPAGAVSLTAIPAGAPTLTAIPTGAPTWI